MSRKRISRDDMFIKIVQVVAQRSTCLRSQVGALIVKDGRIISMGYNGPVSGVPACTECMGPGCTKSLHAETNAIAFAARAGVSVLGCTLYCSMSPCINCAKVIVNSGIQEVVFLEKYRSEEGTELLKSSGVKVRELEREIKEALTIEAEPVKHGRWEYNEEVAKWGFPFICKAEGCGKAHNHKEKFCPHCGAKMDLEET